MVKGLLITTVVAARHLAPKDVNGLSDPYFVLVVGRQKVTTKTVHKSLNPVYNETYNFFVDDETPVLRIDGYDKDNVLKDDYLGYYEVDLHAIEKSYGLVGNWYPLKSITMGEIHLRYYFVNLEASDNVPRDAFGFPLRANEPAALEEVVLEHPSHLEDRESLARTGIPHIFRAQAWLTHTGARAKRLAQPALYAELIEKIATAHPDDVKQVDKDLPTTFPGHPFYGAGSDGQKALRRVLLAYSLHNERTHYCQGLNYVVGLLLLVLEEDDAFWVLKIIVEEIFPNYYDYDLGGIQVDNKLVDYYFANYFPDLKIHLTLIDASPSLNCVRWFLGLFVGVFSTQTTLRIWDSFFTSGRDVLLKVYLAVMKHHFPQIAKTKKASEYYLIMNNIPAEIQSPKALFVDVHKHFGKLFQVEKMRAASQKVVADAINKREEVRLRTSTHFSVQELEELKREFVKRADASHKLGKEAFAQLVRPKVGDDVALIDQIFQSFDKSRDGLLDYREFASGLSIYAKGSSDERLAFCFSLLDLSGDGFVQPDELQLILHAQYQLIFPEEGVKYAKKLVDFALTFDVNKDGKLSFEEFKHVVERQPFLLQFWKLGETGKKEVYSFREIAEALPVK